LAGSRCGGQSHEIATPAKPDRDDKVLSNPERLPYIKYLYIKYLIQLTNLLLTEGRIELFELSGFFVVGNTLVRGEIVAM